MFGPDVQAQTVYRLTHQVRDYILITLIWEFHPVSPIIGLKCYVNHSHISTLSLSEIRVANLYASFSSSRLQFQKSQLQYICKAIVLMKRQSNPTDTVSSNKTTRNIIVLSF